jgi:YEATS domain-containing protein 4
VSALSQCTFLARIVTQARIALPVVSVPPFQVTETGWGEFEIAITVCFVDPDEAPVQFIHPLRLYEKGIDCALSSVSYSPSLVQQMRCLLARS